MGWNRLFQRCSSPVPYSLHLALILLFTFRKYFIILLRPHIPGHINTILTNVSLIYSPRKHLDVSKSSDLEYASFCSFCICKCVKLGFSMEDAGGFSLFFLKNRLYVFRVVLGSLKNWVEGIIFALYFLPLYMCSLLQQHPLPQGAFVMIDEPTHLYYLYYAESVVYIRVHSQCYTFHVFGQIYNGLGLLLQHHIE